MKYYKFLIVFFLLFVPLIAVNLSNEEEYFSDINEGDIPVTISINCQTILSNYLFLDENLKINNYVPANGIILPDTTIYVNEGDTVLDALKQAAKIYKIQLEYTQSPNDSYVEGINYIYEYSCGSLSGWMYKVNGRFANKGCSSYVLNSGDNIQWVYTCDLGKDIGEKFK